MSKFLLRFTLFLCLGWFITVSNTQAQQPNDAQFGSIPDSLYQIPTPADTSKVPYLITNKEMDVSFQERNESIVAVLAYHVRLKIFDKTSPEASIVAIPYYFENNMERISSIEAVTHLPDGEQISLEEENIRTININARYNVKEFTIPGIQNGAIVEYRYVIERRYIEELPDFFLSHRVPTLAAKATVTYPKYLRYDAITENYRGSITNDIVYTDTSSVPKIFTIPQPAPIVTERWMAYDIPAVEEEAYISSLNDYRAKIKFLLSNFGIPRQFLENTWEVVVARMRRNTNPWPAIAQNKLAEAKGDSIARAIGSAQRVAIQDSIYQFLNQQVNFSGENAPYSTNSDSAVLAGQAVDQASINQTLVAMLHGAGISAAPVLLSSRESGKINRDFPSFYQFNAQVVRSNINGKTFLMDASFPHSQPGLLPVSMYSGPGLLLEQDSFEWVDINPDKSMFDIDVDVDATLQSNGTLTGKISSQQSGYPAQLIRQQMSNGLAQAEILKRTLFDGLSNVLADSISISNLSSYDQPVELNARFTIENYATSFTDGLKFRPMIVGAQYENPFKDTDRKFPVTLDAPEKLDVSYNISLPQGYDVPEGKQNRSLSLPGGEFEENYDSSRGALEYNYHINISQKNFSTYYFPQLYNLYQRWVELSNTAWLIEN